MITIVLLDWNIPFTAQDGVVCAILLFPSLVPFVPLRSWLHGVSPDEGERSKKEGGKRKEEMPKAPPRPLRRGRPWHVKMGN